MQLQTFVLPNRVARRRARHNWSLAVVSLFVAGCNAPKSSKVPEFLENLPALATVSSRHDTAMKAFMRDLESWSAQAGRPSSAEALIGPLFLRASRFHTMPPATDTGLEASYQRLEVRFASLLAQRDSIRLAANSERDQLLDWATKNATRVADSREQFRAPVYPPTPSDTGRGSVALTVQCQLITVSTLPSKEGVHICITTGKRCTQMPSDAFGDAWWLVNCDQFCFDYIGWVPEKRSFSIREK